MQTMLNALTAAALFLSLGAGSQAATLRTTTSLNASVVRLSDLFDGAGPGGGRELGPGPGPGGRMVIESAQLGAIARQFAVDWRPVSAGDRVVLDRPGRPLRTDEALEPLRAALAAAGAAPGFELELAAFAPPLVPSDGTPGVQVTRLDYVTAESRFTAVLTVTAGGMDPFTVRVVGRAEETVELPVATARLPMGSVLRDGDLRLVRVRMSQARGEVAQRPEEAVGMQLRRQTVPGQPLALADLARPALVQRGATVAMQLDSQGLSLAARGQAMEAGVAGERIRVINPITRAVMGGVVTGPNLVRIEPDAVPAVTAVRTAQVTVR